MPYSNITNMYSDIDSPERLGIGLIHRNDAYSPLSWDIPYRNLLAISDRIQTRMSLLAVGFSNWIVLDLTHKNFISVSYACIAAHESNCHFHPWLALETKGEKKIILLFSNANDMAKFLLHLNAEPSEIGSLKKSENP